MLRDISRSCIAAECDRCGVVSGSVAHYDEDCLDAIRVLENGGWLIDYGDNESTMMTICPECTHQWSEAVLEWKRRMNGGDQL